MTPQQASQAQRGGGVALVGLVWGVVTLVASFFLAGQGDVPGDFFISRQALWNGGSYYVKMTYLLTLLTLFDVVGVPLILFAGVRAVMKAKATFIEPPPSWDFSQTGRKVKQLALVAVLSVMWVAYTGLALFSPATLKPLGFLASTLLLVVPILPLFIPAVLFDALAPIHYVEGVVESVHTVRNRNNVTTHVVIAGENLQTTPEKVVGVTAGVRAGALVSGFFGSVLRLEKRA